MSIYNKAYEHLAETVRNIQKFDEMHEMTYSLSVADISILKSLKEKDTTIVSLTKELKYDKAFISRRVTELVECGYVRKIPINLKSNHIVITEAGLIKIEEVQRKIDEIYKGVIPVDIMEKLLQITDEINEKIIIELEKR
ncbi:MAG: hypothetical protein ACRCV7_01015 [Culicoidibacterales bacterium]